MSDKRPDLETMPYTRTPEQMEKVRRRLVAALRKRREEDGACTECINVVDVAAVPCPHCGSSPDANGTWIHCNTFTGKI